MARYSDSNGLPTGSANVLAVDGNSNLGERVNSLLDSTKSKSILVWEEENARHKEEQKKEKEDHERKHAEWIDYLKATPDIGRHPPKTEIC